MIYPRKTTFIIQGSATLTMFLLSFAPSVASAQVVSCQDVIALLDRIANFLSAIIAAVAIVVILVGAFYLLFGGGSETAVTTGRKLIIYGLVGIAIALLAFSLPILVKNILKISPASCPF